MSRHPGRRGKHLQKMRKRAKQQKLDEVASALDGVPLWRIKWNRISEGKQTKRIQKFNKGFEAGYNA